MKKLVLLLMLLAFVFGGKAQEKLFNEKDLNGWEILNGKAPFKVKDKCIVGEFVSMSPSTWLATKKQYTNFILEYEMFTDIGINSGVQIRSKFIDDKKIVGLQVEADATERAWSGGLYDQGRQGWRYPLEYNKEAKSAFKVGEWNKVKVVAYENHVATWVNGISVANLMEEKVETGFIALQVHSIANKSNLEGKLVKWRNLTIKELNKKPRYKAATAPLVSYLHNELTPEEKAEGWKLLWDGKTTKGWRGAKQNDFPSKGWVMKDGILTVESSDGGESTNGGDIVTTKPYKNFILEVDFKFSKGGNSGIKYFVDTELNKGKGSAIGCEFQILDDKFHPDAKKGVDGKRTIGSLYDLMRADSRLYVRGLSRDKYVIKGKWNRARVVVQGAKVQHVLNGCTVVEYDRSSQMWKSLVAYSKYKNWPNFGEAEEGLILLQDHGDEVHFKNIKIKEL
ncbi:DUF1080 domain-containing protein [Labilibacter sediminis]|nr:DUF1080 domain-containing protein [Labilibacter sediminis]